jgi:hypothetical protein
MAAVEDVDGPTPTTTIITHLLPHFPLIFTVTLP